MTDKSVSGDSPPLPHTFSLFTALTTIFFRRQYPAAELSNPKSEYEPLDYDAPDQPSILLMFTNDADYFSPHFSPKNNRSTLSSIDHSSSSKNASGADESNNTHLDNLRRSRPSSVVSNYLSFSDLFLSRCLLLWIFFSSSSTLRAF